MGTHAPYGVISSKKQGKVCVAVFGISCCIDIIDTQHSVDRPMFYLAFVFLGKN